MKSSLEKSIKEKTEAYNYMRSKYPVLHSKERAIPWRHLSERDKEICGELIKVIFAFENKYDVTVNSFSKPAGFWDVKKRKERSSDE
tara:strand:- start:596 stop:856 length:261 start_codon:yes stop_codon:yes gene_type:complete